MPLLAQCGYGRNTKIEDGIQANTLAGVIMSPRDEKPERLEPFCSELRQISPDAFILFDPQFYATPLSSARDGQLSNYPYYKGNVGLSRNRFRPNQIQSYVKDCLGYQYTCLPDLSRLISPTVGFGEFDDAWSQIALNMADASIDFHAESDSEPALLISIMIPELALRDFVKMNEFLDTLSAMDVAGFYLIVQRNGNSLNPAMDSVALANMMYLVYVLGELNQFELVMGYSDWIGGLFQAVGATYSASGWHNGLRQFSMARFLPTTGGGRARKRYSSFPMLSSPLLTPELDDIYKLDMLPFALTNSPHDEILLDGPGQKETEWTDAIACQAHWHSLELFYTAVESVQGVPAKLERALATINTAEILYTQFQTAGVQFEVTTGPAHLSFWRDAIQRFRQEAAI